MDKFLELFSIEGRANRAWYFWHILLDDLAIFTAGFGLMVLAAVTGLPFLILPAIGIVMAGAWAGVCITIKRLHDLGRSGWHMLLFFVPLYNLYLGLVLLLKKGTDGANDFGPDPLNAYKALP